MTDINKARAMLGMPFPEENEKRLFTYDEWTGGNSAFIKAMLSGQAFECDEEMWEYWLGVLPPVYPPNPVTMPDGSKVRADFGFAEGYELITVFWRKDGRFFGCRTNLMNRC